LTEELRAGEVIWLGESNAKFLGLFTETFLQQRNDAILLLHGMGAHPDWPNVISPLRWEFPSYLLPVLSIQLPILLPDASVSGYGKTTKEAARRIKIAVDYLHEQGFKRVMLVGFSFGAALGAYYLASEKDHGVSAFIAISILARKFLNPTLNLKFLLEKIDIPMLDIYASKDLEEILKAVPDRRLAAHKSGNASFNQIEISGSDHIYKGHIVNLVKVIVDWIAQHPHFINEDIINANQPYGQE
jgi:pimeloyl-ACP methyl ester carboxylesterase